MIDSSKQSFRDEVSPKTTCSRGLLAVTHLIALCRLQPDRCVIVLFVFHVEPGSRVEPQTNKRLAGNGKLPLIEPSSVCVCVNHRC